MKFNKLRDQDVFAEDTKIGEIEDVYFDTKSWKVTHLEIRFTKEAAFEILGAKMPIRNKLDILSLKEENACCTYRGIEIKVTKKQLHSYLQPPENHIT